MVVKGKGSRKTGGASDPRDRMIVGNPVRSDPIRLDPRRGVAAVSVPGGARHGWEALRWRGGLGPAGTIGTKTYAHDGLQFV